MCVERMDHRQSCCVRGDFEQPGRRHGSMTQSAQQTAPRTWSLGCSLLILVRHADAGDKRQWVGDDSQRPLSRLGRNQAAGLADALQRWPVRRVVSSPLLRCRQTVAPLAHRLGLRVSLSDDLSPDATVWQLEDRLASALLDGTVFCTHREDLTRLLGRWQTCNIVELPAQVQCEKGSAWIIDGSGPRPTARYLAPTLASYPVTRTRHRASA
jgi:hypothetical protein